MPAGGPTRLRCSVLVMVAALVSTAVAGGPLYVAGVSGFDPGSAGTPLTWAGGQVTYYTDRGDLSSLLSGATADALVADAFSRWASVPTAALTVTRGGQLDEDVSGANFTRAGTLLTMPADVQPGSAKPVAIVYDYSGAVIDALLGAGSSAAQFCDSNMVVGGPDRFTADGHLAHALLIINGNCAGTSSDIPVLRYRLLRMLGRVLGLDWSQLNDNVVSKTPAPGNDDYAGFPLMHPAGSLCTSAYGCLYNADQLRMDDRAAISRLYPVTPENLANFSGKQVFATSTARVHGVVRFPDWDGAPGAGMQGVNVVARLLDATTGKASRSVAAASVSGFLFRGNAGNAITGFAPSGGDRYDHWGSDDHSWRGYFDLAGLEIPAASSSAQYELSVEAINPAYTGALSVGPYKLAQVTPSGTAEPLVVTLARGADLEQGINLRGGAAEPADAYEPHSFAAPAAVPGAGHWTASLSGYGDVDWHVFSAAAHRSFTLDVTALDESGAPTENKALPVIGLWEPDAADSAPPLLAQTYFTSGLTGVTRLQATLAAAGEFKIGISDHRGDGRPDFRYHARLLYAAEVTPAHASVGGGTVLRITGLGLSPELIVSVGGVETPILSFTPEAILVAAPAMSEGTKTVTLEDPDTGASASLIDALSYGGGSDDMLELLLGANPPVPVGTPAPNPFRVRVLAADGVTPVTGAAVTFTAPGTSVSLLPCNATNCRLASDGAGEAEVWIVVKAAGATTLAATLANGSSVSATVNGVSSALAVAAVPPRMYVAKSTSASVPLRVRVAGNGVPLSGRVVQFQVMLGTGTVAAAQVTTDAWGEAATTLSVINLASEVRVSACVGVWPQPTACDIFYLYPVENTGVHLLKTAGDQQWVNPGQQFAPLTVRVLDASQPPNTVAGMPVLFRVTALQPQSDSGRTLMGEVLTGHYAQPVVLANSEMVVNSDGWGEARVAPQFPAEWGSIVVNVEASLAGGDPVTFTLHTWPEAVGGPPLSRPPLAGQGGATPTASPAPPSATARPIGPPSRSPSCTRAGCSAASAPSGPRRGSKASSKAP